MHERDLECVIGEVFVESPAVASQESTEQPAVTREGTEVKCSELVERVGDHRVAPVDDPEQPVSPDEQVILSEVTVHQAPASLLGSEPK